ncbi:hypothetical protein FA95DRAFT_614603 [Auriscalpium vulgare]|uniref:Uncharacterized protein n=1 Tax=Auriscalpium vulgare TaxID=40419 RepID=A0ACB8RDP6_9AGAM|nr:hypothetical protein FA95DRAFT_614603 [Auriscalpium vulgare]
MSIARLPAELLCNILLHLDLRTLLSVQLTCRRLRDVMTTSTIQFTMLLEAMGMCAGGHAADRTISSSDRLAMLEDYEKAWAAANWMIEADSTPLPAEHFRFCGGIAASVVNHDSKSRTSSLVLTRLPSLLRDIPRHQWKITVPLIHDYLIDPLQDLVVVMSFPATRDFYTFHALSLTTGSIHPLAASYAVYQTSKPGVYFQICGCYVGMVRTRRATNIGVNGAPTRHISWVIFNWQTGQSTSLCFLLFLGRRPRRPHSRKPLQ